MLFRSGGNGIWASCYNTSDKTFCLGDYSTEPWYMGLDKPASYEMNYLIKFYNLIGFKNLIPNFNILSEDIVVSSTNNNSTIVIYFYNEKDENIELVKLLDKKYYSYWYNPLTGNFIKNKSFVPQDGIYKIPTKPTKSDWVLLLTINDYKIDDFEKNYNDKELEINFKNNNVKKYLDTKAVIDKYKIYCVSNEDELCDFKNIKYNPYCDITTKTINIEFSEEKYVDLIKIDFESKIIPKFRIYGIDKEGKVFLITDCKYRKPNIISDNKKYILEKIDGSYKTIKILILNDNVDLKINNINLFR